MSDLISRQEAIDALETIGYDFSDSGLSEIELEEVCEAVGDVRQDMIDRIKQLPSAQSERKTGKWIVISEFEDCRYVQCNQCKVTQVFYYNKPLTNFCPNCGVDMRGGNNDDPE